MASELDDYINTLITPENCYLWKIGTSSLGGRGVFASRSIPENTELFREPALLIGPRSGALFKQLCVNCHKPGRLKPCPLGCGMPVCIDKCNKDYHRECGIVRKLPEVFSKRMAAVTPLRAVFMDDAKRSILRNLECHERKEHAGMLESLRNLLSPEDLSIVKTCVEVLDATAFETPCGDGVSLRGIYPCGALLNHECSPNTRHSFDSEGKMVVVTTKPVRAGEEFTNSYTSLTWGTAARSSVLKATKNFLCQCKRCMDPTEFGSCLMSLYCMKRGCGGDLLPSLEEKGVWQCLNCGTKMPAMQMNIIQKMVQKSVSTLDSANPQDGCRLLRKQCLVPSSNHFAVQFKLSLITMYGNQGFPFRWSDLSVEDLVLKDLLCAELILLCSVLQLGLCLLRGMLLQELAKTLTELHHRNIYHTHSQFLLPYKNITEITMEANRILGKPV